MLLMNIMYIMILMNLMFMLITHPLMLTLIIVIQTLMICLLMGSLSYSFWFSYILFLIFLGGMLILFIYITSLASNEYIKISNNIISTMLISMIILYFYSSPYNSINFNSKLDSMNSMIPIMSNESPKNLSQLYNYPNLTLTLLTILYLLFTMIIIVNITNIQKGPLRQMYTNN